MDFYYISLLGALALAGILNFYHVRQTFLVFLTAFFLVLVPQLLPDPDSLGMRWFPLLAMIEVAYGLLTLFLFAPASRVVALFSGWNLFGYCLGVYGYARSDLVYEWYNAVIQAGEMCQVASLILFSTPVVRSLKLILNDRDRDNGAYRVVHGYR